jgi:pimeloyl-ACP methyl ester carboxylesterase
MLNFKDWTSQQTKSVEGPTLLLLGDPDVVRPEHAVNVFHLLPHARLAVLPGTDHMTILKRGK